MKQLLLTVIFFAGLAHAHSQVTDITNPKLKTAKVRSLLERTVDSLKHDTIPTFAAFFDTAGRIIEKRYSYRKENEKSKNYAYTSELYSYNTKGELTKTDILNELRIPGGILDGYYVPTSTECRTLDNGGNTLKLEFSDGMRSTTTLYTYRSFPQLDRLWGTSIKLPSVIELYEHGKLQSKTVIEYTVY